MNLNKRPITDARIKSYVSMWRGTPRNQVPASVFFLDYLLKRLEGDPAGKDTRDAPWVTGKEVEWRMTELSNYTEHEKVLAKLEEELNVSREDA